MGASQCWNPVDESAPHSEPSNDADAEPRKYDVKGPNAAMITHRILKSIEVVCRNLFAGGGGGANRLSMYSSLLLGTEFESFSGVLAAIRPPGPAIQNR